MQFSDDIDTNEKLAADHGQRNIVTWEQVSGWLGSDNLEGKTIELLMDVLNEHYPLEDCVAEVLAHEE